MDSHVRCKVCGGAMTPRLAWVWQCPACGFLASTLPSGAGTGVDGLESLRRENYEVILGRLDVRLPLAGARLLEVGCARGWFMEAVRARAGRPHGIEPERANAERCAAAGLSVECGFFPADLVDRGPFEAVVFNDVFEHLPDPAEAVCAVEELLRPGGFAVFNVPSSRGALFRIATLLVRVGVMGPLERLWQKEFASPHISYFSPANLRLLVERHSAMRLVEVFPLPATSRRGLRSRIGRSDARLREWVMFAAAWSLTFLLPWLPSDIAVLVFRRSDVPRSVS